MENILNIFIENFILILLSGIILNYISWFIHATINSYTITIGDLVGAWFVIIPWWVVFYLFVWKFLKGIFKFIFRTIPKFIQNWYYNNRDKVII